MLLGEGPAPARVEVGESELRWREWPCCGTVWSCEAEEGRGAAVCSHPAVPLELGADGEGVVGLTVVAPGLRTRNELSAVWGRTPLL